MSEPVSSSNRSQSSDFTADPSLDETGLVCRSNAPRSSQPEPASSSEPPPTPPAVTQLLSAVPPPAAKLPPALAPSTPPAPSTLPQAQNNAQRTSELHGIVPGYFDYDVTGGWGDSVFVGAAALKGRDPKSGIEVEVFSGSAQVGLQNEAQAGLARMGVSGRNGSVTAELFTARANEGIHNDDGSIGLNAGAVVNFANLEGTLTHGADSLTAGLGAGVGYAFSFGLRDIDGDGAIEVCVKGTAGPVTLGVCAED
jgi:hypothetical protein